MSTIITRSGKGSLLTPTEVDTNLTNLNMDKLEKSSNLSDLASTATARSNLGLGNVNNTTDATKPVSADQLAALNLKQDIATAVTKDSTTGAARMPVGTTAQRPINPQYGDERTNSTTNHKEWWDSVAWVAMEGSVSRKQIGLSLTTANNFTLTAEADNGTMKLARGNAGATTQDVMTVDAAGKVAFPQNVQAFAAYAPLQTLSWGLDALFASWSITAQTGSFTFNTSNGAVTPLVAGWYAVSGEVNCASSGIGADVSVGGELRDSTGNVARQRIGCTSTIYPVFNLSTLKYFNGTTDYILLGFRKTDTPNAANVSGFLKLNLIAKT